MTTSGLHPHNGVALTVQTKSENVKKKTNPTAYNHPTSVIVCVQTKDWRTHFCWKHLKLPSLSFLFFPPSFLFLALTYWTFYLRLPEGTKLQMVLTHTKIENFLFQKVIVSSWYMEHEVDKSIISRVKIASIFLSMETPWKVLCVLRKEFARSFLHPWSNFKHQNRPQ